MSFCLEWMNTSNGVSYALGIGTAIVIGIGLEKERAVLFTSMRTIQCLCVCMYVCVFNFTKHRHHSLALTAVQFFYTDTVLQNFYGANDIWIWLRLAKISSDTDIQKVFLSFHVLADDVVWRFLRQTILTHRITFFYGHTCNSHFVDV